jgi:hypothetical protein
MGLKIESLPSRKIGLAPSIVIRNAMFIIQNGDEENEIGGLGP